MPSGEEKHTVLELQARWERILIADLYDALEKLGYPNQCLDLGIRSLFAGRRLAGKAVTVRGAREPRAVEELEEPKASPPFMRIRDMLYPGTVVVVECGGETMTGKLGEMACWSMQQKGARGVVMDSYIRDRPGLETIRDFAVFARGTSPIESYRRWRPQEMGIPIALPGTLTNQVRIAPGDWVVGGCDGVLVVPQEIAMEALALAEEIEAREEGMRRDLTSGMPFDDALAKWGRT